MWLIIAETVDETETNSSQGTEMGKKGARKSYKCRKQIEKGRQRYEETCCIFKMERKVLSFTYSRWSTGTLVQVHNPFTVSHWEMCPFPSGILHFHLHQSRYKNINNSSCIKQPLSAGTSTTNHPITALWISYPLFNLLLLQWAVLWEPSTNDLAADQPVRPIRVPE